MGNDKGVSCEVRKKRSKGSLGITPNIIKVIICSSVPYQKKKKIISSSVNLFTHYFGTWHLFSISIYFHKKKLATRINSCGALRSRLLPLMSLTPHSGIVAKSHVAIVNLFYQFNDPRSW